MAMVMAMEVMKKIEKPHISYRDKYIAYLDVNFIKQDAIR